jgi:hypothetical protein
VRLTRKRLHIQSAVLLLSLPVALLLQLGAGCQQPPPPKGDGQGQSAGAVGRGFLTFDDYREPVDVPPPVLSKNPLYWLSHEGYFAPDKDFEIVDKLDCDKLFFTGSDFVALDKQFHTNYPEAQYRPPEFDTMRTDHRALPLTARAGNVGGGPLKNGGGDAQFARGCHDGIWIDDVHTGAERILKEIKPLTAVQNNRL